MTTMTYRGALTVTTCWCGTRHAVPEELYEFQQRQHNDGENVTSIYCPLGHSHVPAGTGKATLERESRERAEAREQHLADQLQAAESALKAQRREATRLKKRAANGVCPCCNRTFQNVGRHMKGQHPDYAAPKGKS